MTFPARLTELLERATKGPWESEVSGNYINVVSPFGKRKVVASTIAPQSVMFRQGIADTELIAYLVNQAEALRDLVVAAKEYYDAQQEWAKYRLALDNAEANYSDPAPDEKLFMAAVLRVNKAEHELSEALAKLECK